MFASPGRPPRIETPPTAPDSTTPGWNVSTWRTSSTGRCATRSPDTVEPEVTLSRGTIGFAATSTVTGPIGNAQVTIVGTSFGALTNDKGYYFINNVPVGTYTVRGRFIGFTAAEVPGVRVQGGFTQTVNIKLTPSAVAIGPVTVEVAANPIVPRDKVTSGSTVSGDLVAHLPVDDVRQVLTFQPGVVESGAVGGVSIRGGRPGEANIYIDGAPVRLSNGALQNASGGTLSGPIRVGTNALEEASVTTGALGVEFSDAQSGVIAYTTKAGGEKLAGSFSTETDEPFGNAISVGWNRFEGSSVSVENEPA